MQSNNAILGNFLTMEGFTTTEYVVYCFIKKIFNPLYLDVTDLKKLISRVDEITLPLSGPSKVN